MTYALAQALGGRAVMASEPATATEWVARIESGLPSAAAFALKDALGLTNHELAAVLGVSPRTLARLDSSRSRLDAVAGDRLVRTARIFAIAVDVIEDAQAAARWMKTPHRALGRSIPLHLAETDVGARAVETLLGRMEFSVYT